MVVKSLALRFDRCRPKPDSGSGARRRDRTATVETSAAWRAGRKVPDFAAPEPDRIERWTSEGTVVDQGIGGKRRCERAERREE